jgi:hypothetical protein
MHRTQELPDLAEQPSRVISERFIDCLLFCSAAAIGAIRCEALPGKVPAAMMAQ